LAILHHDFDHQQFLHIVNSSHDGIPQSTGKEYIQIKKWNSLHMHSRYCTQWNPW